MMLPHIQKQLLLSAIDSVNHASKTGGFLVYSTCSVTIEENEEVVSYALRKRPNVRLVSTDLTFGREGFTSYRGKNFDASLKLTRRYYPHAYNVDGFYVAKFQKVGPTPPSLIRDLNKSQDASGKAAGASLGGETEDEVVDKTPIAADDKLVASGGVEDDGFGGFDEDEDKEYMEKAKRNAMRRRGLDPKALDKSKAKTSKPEEVTEKEQEASKEKKSAAQGAKMKSKKEKKSKA